MRGTDAVDRLGRVGEGVLRRRRSAPIPAKVEVIYNAVDWSQLETTMTRDEFRASIGVPPDVPAAGIIARLTEQKAHRVLFDAMAQHAALSALHLVVVGDGELRDDAASSASTSLGIAARVHFLGARRDLGNILAAIDMFAMPSLWEGLPLSMVLAMGAGLPVVATRVAGIPEVVQHDVSGLLVVAGDSSAARRRRWHAGRGRAAARAAWRARRGRSCCRGSASTATSPRSPRCTIACSRAKGAARDARHPLPHAVLADRRRRVVGSGRIVRALRGFARAVLRRGDSVGAGVRHAAGVGLARAGGERELAPLPYFPGPRQFYPMLPSMRAAAARLGRAVRRDSSARADARRRSSRFASREPRSKPVFLLVVGDYAALLPHLGYRGMKKAAVRRVRGVRGVGAALHDDARADVRERRRAAREARARTARASTRPRRRRSASRMCRRGPTPAPGRRIRHADASAASIRARACGRCRRWSRRSSAAGIDVTLDIVGPTIGLIGESEARRDRRGSRSGAASRDRVHLRGADRRSIS